MHFDWLIVNLGMVIYSVAVFTQEHTLYTVCFWYAFTQYIGEFGCALLCTQILVSHSWVKTAVVTPKNSNMPLKVQCTRWVRLVIICAQNQPKNYTFPHWHTFLTSGLPSWDNWVKVIATPKSIWFAWSDLSPELAINLPKAKTAAARTLKKVVK